MTHFYKDKEGFHEALRVALENLQKDDTRAVAVFDESYPASLSERARVEYVLTPYGKRYRIVRVSADVVSSGAYFEAKAFEDLYANVLRLFAQLEAASKRRWDLLSRVKTAKIVDTFDHVARLGFEIKERSK